MGIKEKIKETPALPGVYLFKDKAGKIIYIGKAGSLKNRLRSHFLKRDTSKHVMLIDSTEDIDYILTPDEATALLLEAALIKRYMPKYNVMLKDDKSYPRLKLTVNEEYPRLFITRKLKADNALYFGPYTNAALLRKALKTIRRVFPLRTCNKMPKASASKGCLDFHIGQCIGPCMDSGRKRDYLDIVKELKLFLEGKQKELFKLLTGQMRKASSSKDYETAAKIRDRLKALAVVADAGDDYNKERRPGFNNAEKPLFMQAEELRRLLNLAREPKIIEIFDVSNTSGKEAVGSMVCFKDNKPYKSRYMHFRIKTVNVIDDYSMMREIVSRRYKRLLSQKGVFPDLIIIDGGRGHLAAAKSQLRSLKIIDVPVIGIAKNPDKIYIHEKREPILFGRFDKALLLCQRMRDEAHRFAITYHRSLRRKKAVISELDNIKGIGPKRKAELIKYFGSFDRIRRADIDELKKVAFVDEKEAKVIYDYFRV